MTDEPTNFRDRLLGAQQVTPDLRAEYRKDLDALLHHRLTPRSRALTWAALIFCIGFAIACVISLIRHHAKQDAKIILPAYAAVFASAAFWLARVLRQGGFARRASFVIVEALGSVFVSVFVAVTLFRTMSHPADPASTYAAVWAVMLMMVGFAWGTGKSIAAAALENREHLLRLESRLADLAERLPK